MTQKSQKKLVVKVKKINKSAQILTQETRDIPDAGWDLFSAERTRVPGHSKKAIGTGIAIEMPTGIFGNIRNRSGRAINTPLMVDAGIVDPGYRGEIKVVLVNIGEFPWDVEIGAKIAQIIFEEISPVEIEEVTELLPSERGEKGFGSTGT
jgi:dUTP pyrophosphatase